MITNHRYSIGLGVMVLLLAVSNLLLLRQNLQLRTTLNRLEPEKLREGETLPPFSAHSLSGETVSLQYADGQPRRVLMFFTPTCPYSREQFTYWRKIIEMAPTKNFEVIALARDSENKRDIEMYLKSVDCPPESKYFHVAFIPDQVRHNYKFVITPTTVIASSEGKAEKVWNGQLTTNDIANADVALGLQ